MPHPGAVSVSLSGSDVTQCAPDTIVEKSVDTAVDKTVNNVMLRLWKVHDSGVQREAQRSPTTDLILSVDAARTSASIAKPQTHNRRSRVRSRFPWRRRRSRRNPMQANTHVLVAMLQSGMLACRRVAVDQIRDDRGPRALIGGKGSGSPRQC